MQYLKQQKKTNKNSNLLQQKLTHVAANLFNLDKNNFLFYFDSLYT
jgi:hypothetical protein